MASQPTAQRVPGARPLTEWANLFGDPAGPAYCRLARIYSGDRTQLREKAAFVLQALRAFAAAFRPRRPVLLVRSAGRINLVGMHVDHRGGPVNPIAVRETWFVCEPRDDDVLDCASIRPDRFPRAAFSIRAELGDERIADWDRWTQERAERRKTDGMAGDWTNYLKAAALYLEHVRPVYGGERPLRGMNVLVAGTLPLGAGLSWSSSLVVGAAEALLRLNGLSVPPRQLVELCGEAEWYVGTRGGCGDHAAIKFGKLNHVSHLGSYPLTVEAVPFPEEFRVILCNSLIEARKSETARDEFNRRIASYEFGLMQLCERFPDLAPRMPRLRDVNPETLGVDEAEIYRMLLALPERADRRQVLGLLAAHRSRLLHIFGSHAEPADGYRIRGVCAFGIAECLRSRLAAEALRRGDLAAFGEITNLSQDGDRVTRVDSSGRRVPVDKSIPDAFLLRRIEDLGSGDPARVERARLWRLPGAYDASLPELDTIVDACLATPGVVAARIVGAGLGGGVHAVVHRDRVEEVIRNLTRLYYEPRGLSPSAEPYRPVEGAGVFEV